MHEPTTSMVGKYRVLAYLGRGGMAIMAAHQDINVDVPVTTVRL